MHPFESLLVEVHKPDEVADFDRHFAFRRLWGILDSELFHLLTEITFRFRAYQVLVLLVLAAGGLQLNHRVDVLDDLLRVEIVRTVF